MIIDNKYSMEFQCDKCVETLKINGRSKVHCLYLARSFGWSVNPVSGVCLCREHAMAFGHKPKNLAWHVVEKAESKLRPIWADDVQLPLPGLN